MGVLYSLFIRDPSLSSRLIDRDPLAPHWKDLINAVNALQI